MSQDPTGHDHTRGMAKRTLRLAFAPSARHHRRGIRRRDHLALPGIALGCRPCVHRHLCARSGLVRDRTGQTERYHRVGILTGLANALTLILIAFWIVWEAVQHFQHPEPIQPLVIFLSAGIGIAVNLFIGFGLHRGGDNFNVLAATLHVFGDVEASVGVIAAGLVILLTGWTSADPLLSIGIAGLIAVGIWRIVRETADILLEATPGASLCRPWRRI